MREAVGFFSKEFYRLTMNIFTNIGFPTQP